ncbi:MAG TPA: cell division protein FtsL [Thermoanaerobaculia bacterium]|nr:cell division protein FtsL [Thermoanaerobaculia bacterium]
MSRAYSVHRPVANEYLVRERDRRRLRELGLVLLVLAPIALALTAFTWIHLQVLDAGYRIEELEDRRHELERRESRLRLEAAYLASPNLIERRAREELAMRPPDLAQLVFPRASPPAAARAGSAAGATEEPR